jgi:hypothetical protein
MPLSMIRIAHAQYYNSFSSAVPQLMVSAMQVAHAQFLAAFLEEQCRN